jgi:BirA family biotin operon repressor/biotin-[acetyl-CoA-carboxylase] ligase
MSEIKTEIEKDILKKLLNRNNRDIDVLVYESIDSTNNEAKRLFKNGNGNMLICSKMQTAGRGRSGKNFYSPDKTGVYMSVVIRRKMPLTLAAKATTAAAVAVCEAIEALTDKKPQIKWVNDIFLENKKICGILTEAVASENKKNADGLIIGIGINVSTDSFPDELKGIAGSLNEKGIDKNLLVSFICDRVIEYSECLEKTDCIAKYKERCFILGKEISYMKSGENFTATAVDIDANGGLVVKDKNGEVQTLQSGEISIKI